MVSKTTSGFSLMETSVALSLIALLISVFVALSSRLAQAQAQQSVRAGGLEQLQIAAAELKRLGPQRWSTSAAGGWRLPFANKEIPLAVGRGRVIYRVTAEPVSMPSVMDASLGGFVISVRWDSSTGEQKLRREVWAHAPLQ